MPNPRDRTLIELGSGEGNLIETLLELGMEYLGLDCSEHAIAKAKQRTDEAKGGVDVRVVDVLKLDDDIGHATFDLVLDVACFHMFVLDKDARTYLSNAKELMKPHSAFILVNQARKEEANDGEIRSIGEYQDIFDDDLSTPKEWEPWDGQKWRSVMLPRFPCRPRSPKHYAREFEKAGFRLSTAEEAGSQRQYLDFHLQLQEDGTG